MNQQGTSRELARYVRQLKYEDLSRSVVEKAKEIILDQVGVQIACSTLPWNKVVYDYVEGLGARGRGTVVNFGLKTHPELAALANATFGHGFELDDGQLQAPSHPGCVAVPVSLAVGEEHGITGKQLLLAVAIGSEVIIRVGLALGMSLLVDRGFHFTSVQGPFGAAAAAGKILDLDEDALLNALSIAGSHCSGTAEYGQTGGDVKRLHAGIAAAGGIRAAYLAKLGLTGPPTILEGKRGVIQAFSACCDIDKITDGVGEVYHMLGVDYKRYCCCGAIFPQIEAVSEIVSQHNLKPEDIEEIIIGTNALTHSHSGTIGSMPTDITGAQFSIHFSLGLTVAKGSNDFATYIEAMESNFQDPSVLDISRRVRVEIDEECEKAVRERSLMCKATIKTKDGRSLDGRAEWPGMKMANPVTREELEQKFASLASEVFPEARVMEMKEMILSLEDLECVSELTGLVTK